MTVTNSVSSKKSENFNALKVYAEKNETMLLTGNNEAIPSLN